MRPEDRVSYTIVEPVPGPVALLREGMLVSKELPRPRVVPAVVSNPVSKDVPPGAPALVTRPREFEP